MKGKDLTERVYKKIKRDIMLGKIPSGELFSEQMLADRYECSRTPAREAAGQLVMEGFLNKYPSKGYIIRQLTQKETREMYFCLYTLEQAALELSLHNAWGEDIQNLVDLIDKEPEDPEDAVFSNLIFHCELARLSGNDAMVRLIEQLHCRLIRGDMEPLDNPYSYLGEKRSHVSASSRSDQHRAIVNALLCRDLHAASDALRLDFYPEGPHAEKQQERP